ncbi:tRNA lysidine(34) synthetase TilS [Paenibacillus sp.]|uniref:tRNA lysidine(34) synthetase TilS n=1 Tax=Paenibacillus sp. TaxID=58172 RepID=UPI002D494C17|nr:tRNA lysidine(34) synthetase TilS [Paenibacillus sp.]HZG87569.1 tRNA lysidine(34) synthetase TilS [Paenibacillus sp.]
MGEDELARRVERLIRERALFAPGERFVAAVSGGPDSVALLHLLHALAPRFDWALAAVHVNHGLRGDESDAEEAYVRELCERLGLPCFVRRVDVYAALAAHGNNKQAAARTLRLAALRSAAAEWGGSSAALGHHADDQAETVLMRMLRGTGPGGLGGIRFTNVVDGMKLVRPLLRINKIELASYCERHGLSPRFDSSNASRDYFRNVVRLDLLPYIMKFRSGAGESLRRIAELTADEDDLLDALARERVRAEAKRGESSIRLGRDAFLAAHIALQRRMIKIILNSLYLDEDSVDFAKIERMREAIAADAPTTLELRLDGRTVFRRSYDALEWARDEPAPAGPFEFAIDVARDGRLALGGVNGELAWRLLPADRFEPPPSGDPFAAWFDADALAPPWIVRSRRAGDRMEPFGLNGTKTVKDMFVDGKLPRRLREAWPVVTSREGDLLWVPGFRRAKAGAVTASTVRILAMELRVQGNIFD